MERCWNGRGQCLDSREKSKKILDNGLYIRMNRGAWVGEGEGERIKCVSFICDLPWHVWIVVQLESFLLTAGGKLKADIKKFFPPLRSLFSFLLRLLAKYVFKKKNLSLGRSLENQRGHQNYCFLKILASEVISLDKY